VPDELADVGLHEGETVRWRRSDGGHWQTGAVIGLERDGSVAVRDTDGAWRSIVADRLEAKRPNHRGRLVWRSVEDTSAQLSLWDPAPTKTTPTRTKPRRSTSLRPVIRPR
jgi:hypothetical protein